MGSVMERRDLCYVLKYAGGRGGGGRCDVKHRKIGVGYVTLGYEENVAGMGKLKDV